MPQVVMSRRDDVPHYTLDSKTLSNGDEVELQLGGNRGWVEVTVTGLPQALRVTWTNDANVALHTTLPPEAHLRWR